MTKILIVDDEPGIVELLVEYLEDRDYEVVTAEDGATAVAQIYREKPDVVLLDLMLPVMNGYGVLQELRQNPQSKNLPVVMLTDVSPSEGEQAAVELGVTHYMSKPWQLSSLEAVIRVALREAGASGWSKPSTDHLHNVKQFQLGPVISPAGSPASSGMNPAEDPSSST